MVYFPKMTYSIYKAVKDIEPNSYQYPYLSRPIFIPYPYMKIEKIFLDESEIMKIIDRVHTEIGNQDYAAYRTTLNLFGRIERGEYEAYISEEWEELSKKVILKNKEQIPEKLNVLKKIKKFVKEYIKEVNIEKIGDLRFSVRNSGLEDLYQIEEACKAGCSLIISSDSGILRRKNNKPIGVSVEALLHDSLSPFWKETFHFISYVPNSILENKVPFESSFEVQAIA